MNLFKKAAVFTDLHLGLKSNSITHNEDCWAYIQWMVAKAKEEGCETCIFTGDYHNNRASINILTLNYSIRCLEHLAANFDRVLFIPGNHDLYYREKRDVQSADWARYIPNVEIINDWHTEGDVTIAPWLVGDDHKMIPKLKSKYVFGHFELPHFFMNAMVQMPDHGEVKREAFGHFDHVFSGHFHKRQTFKNITYIGNAFPHNYADASDDERGFMILEWGKDPEFHAWPDQPTFRVLNLSDVLDNPDKMLRPKMHVKLKLDIGISYEEANFIKETFVGQYQLRDVTILPSKNEDLNQQNASAIVEFESVDNIVTKKITEIESDFYDPKILLDIYRNL